jgi:shikimate dehydrogenase
MIEASVIGWPISHSRSPLIHNYWLNKHGVDGNYTKQAVAPDDLPQFLNGLREGPRVGANVTLPHKQNAVTQVDMVDDRVRRIGALNTIWRENGKLCATSTDGAGFVANIYSKLPSFNLSGATVTILGAGGSTRAIIDEVLRAGVDRISVSNRTLSRAETLARHFGERVHVVEPGALKDVFLDTDLLINTTSAGLNGEGELPLPWDSLAHTAVVADIVYTPLITPFLLTAKSREHATIPGLGMLLYQAVVGFEKWFGVRPQVTQTLYDLVARDIDPDYVA